jgi:hypothetical protein
VFPSWLISVSLLISHTGWQKLAALSKDAQEEMAASPPPWPVATSSRCRRHRGGLISVGGQLLNAGVETEHHGEVQFASLVQPMPKLIWRNRRGLHLPDGSDKRGHVFLSRHIQKTSNYQLTNALKWCIFDFKLTARDGGRMLVGPLDERRPTKALVTPRPALITGNRKGAANDQP